MFAVQIMSPSCYGSRANDDDLATTGKAKEVHLVMYILTVSLVWKYFVSSGKPADQKESGFGGAPSG